MGILAFMDELGKNVGLELHNLVYCEQHTGIDHLWVKFKSYTPVCNKGLKCLYVEMAEYLS
jgi:hypothetical protein